MVDGGAIGGKGMAKMPYPIVDAGTSRYKAGKAAKVGPGGKPKALASNLDASVDDRNAGRTVTQVAASVGMGRKKLGAKFAPSFDPMANKSAGQKRGGRAP